MPCQAEKRQDSSQLITVYNSSLTQSIRRRQTANSRIQQWNTNIQTIYLRKISRGIDYQGTRHVDLPWHMLQQAAVFKPSQCTDAFQCVEISRLKASHSVQILSSLKLNFKLLRMMNSHGLVLYCLSLVCRCRSCLARLNITVCGLTTGIWAWLQFATLQPHDILIIVKNCELTKLNSLKGSQIAFFHETISRHLRIVHIHTCHTSSYFHFHLVSFYIFLMPDKLCFSSGPIFNEKLRSPYGGRGDHLEFTVRPPKNGTAKTSQRSRAQIHCLEISSCSCVRILILLKTLRNICIALFS